MELVGPRRSYRGLCYCERQLVRMPVWPHTCLLDWIHTLLHEIAHLLDDSPRPHGPSFWEWERMVQDEAFATGFVSRETYEEFVRVSDVRRLREKLLKPSSCGALSLHEVGRDYHCDELLPL